MQGIRQQSHIEARRSDMGVVTHSRVLAMHISGCPYGHCRPIDTQIRASRTMTTQDE